MNRRRTVVTFLSLLLTVVLFPGCDQGSSHRELTITPEEQELSYNGEVVRFTVTDGLRELSLPIEWEVTNPNVGVIVADEGASAIYTRHTGGLNVIVATDQYGAEGIAAIVNPRTESSSGSGYSLTIVANPSETIPEGVSTVTITAINGTAPFSWSVGDSSKGSVPNENDDTILYTSSDTGANTVICVDANSARGTVVITQE